jgi:hypothetical protein
MDLFQKKKTVKGTFMLCPLELSKCIVLLLMSNTGAHCRT